MQKRFCRALVVACLTLPAAACSKSPQEYLNRGNAYADQGKYSEAIIEYRNALREEPKLGEARQKLAEAYERTGDRTRAAREFVRAADLLPTNTALQLKAATLLLGGGQFEDAQTRIDGVLAREPQNIEAITLKAGALAGLKNLDAAIEQMEEAIRLDPSRGATYTNMALLRMARGESDDARTALEKAVEVDPNSVVSLTSLATYKWSTGDVPGAELELRRALAVDPKNATVNRALAMLYMTTNRAAEAEQPLKTIVEVSDSPAPRFSLVDYYVRTKRFDDARALLKPMTTDEKVGLRAEAALAGIERLSGQPDRGYTMLEALLKRQPSNAALLLEKARWQFSDNKRSDALASATAAVAADAKSTDAHYLLGVIHRASGDRDASANEFREVLRLNPNADAARLQLSQVELARGQTASALELAQTVVKNAPENPFARLTLGRTLLARGDMAQAQPMIASLLEKYPNAAAVHALDGTARLRNKDVAGARRSYTRALELDAGLADALAGLTMLDATDNKLAEARARLDARQAAEPNRPDLLMLISRFQMGTRDWPAAEKTLRHLIDVSPAEVTAYSMLAQVYLAQRQLDRAQQEFDGIVKRTPGNVGAATMGAIISEAKQNLPDAKERYRKVMAMSPTAGIAANNLSWLYADSNENLDEALRLAQTAVRELPKRAEAHDTLGWVQYKRELAFLAIPAFEESIKLDPANPQYHYHLGLALVKSGEPDKARVSLKRALELKPDFAESADARKVLQSIGG
jgi:putative PEP-CTERM system TPR-repeat lipoprotein